MGNNRRLWFFDFGLFGIGLCWSQPWRPWLSPGRDSMMVGPVCVAWW